MPYKLQTEETVAYSCPWKAGEQLSLKKFVPHVPDGYAVTHSTTHCYCPFDVLLGTTAPHEVEPSNQPALPEARPDQTPTGNWLPSLGGRTQPQCAAAIKANPRPPTRLHATASNAATASVVTAAVSEMISGGAAAAGNPRRRRTR